MKKKSVKSPVGKNVKKALRPKGKRGKTFSQEAKYERARKNVFGMK